MESTLDKLVGDVPPTDVTPRKPNGDGRPHVRCIPYNANFDKDADKLLPWLWKQISDDGLVELYFPGQKDFGFASFVKLLSGGEQVLLVTLCDNDNQPQEVIGFVSWNNVAFLQANAAMAGFIFLRKYWDNHVSTEAGRETMRYWFDDLKLDVVLGCVAEHNRPALMYLHRLNWKRVGDIPLLHSYKGQQCANVLWYVTKDEYQGKVS